MGFLLGIEKQGKEADPWCTLEIINGYSVKPKRVRHGPVDCNDSLWHQIWVEVWLTILFKWNFGQLMILIHVKSMVGLE